MRWLTIVAVLAGAANNVSAQPAAAPPAAGAQGKIVALKGRVDHTPPQEQWTPARLLQPLLVAERVRTLEASRAAILFIDETQVKLNAGAILTIREVRRPGGGPTSLELGKGEGWFRTKNPRSGLTIQTPAAAAAVRGTEINLRVGPADETVLTVVEGTAAFSNAQGSLLVNAGEEATARPGDAPTKRVILNPEDAVQWTLYYPGRIAWHDLPATVRTGPSAQGFERLRAGDAAAAQTVFQSAPGDPWAAIGGSMAHLALGDIERARSVLGEAAGPDRLAQLATVLLATGDAAAARSALEKALAQDATALRPLLAMSSLELRQNRPDRARDAAQRALAAHPESVGALVAASEAAQARFDLSAARSYLDRAIALDPRDVPALVNRARIRFGTDDTPGARVDADAAAAVAANDPQVRSLRGFIQLADGHAAAARTDFEAAVLADPEFGEPHLGLGLAEVRDGRLDEGLLEMLTASLLEPKVALYQSYLGKAYYQAARFPEGLSALASAKRLDPRDPTPWLYASLYLRDQNQQVEALDELRQAIVLNDYRAVYRGRLLLDRDLATKNVSLAEIYRQLGFEAWGAYEALNSLETDVTSASAHLFMAETYGLLPDRTQALGSELLQYFLYAPVNRNSFNNFAEYTALLEQPRQQLTATVDTGSRERLFGNVSHRSGNERFAHVAFIQMRHQTGARLDRDDRRVQGFVQGKLALGRRSDLFFSFSGVHDDSGAGDTTTSVFGLESGTPIILRQFTTTPNAALTARFREAETTVGLKHQWSPGSTLTASVRYDNLEQVDERTVSLTSLCEGIDLRPFDARSRGRIANPFELFDVQVQQTMRFGRHQVVIGQQAFRLNKGTHCSETISFEGTTETLPLQSDDSGADEAQVTYVRDEMQLTRRLHATVGLSFNNASYRDLSGGKTFEDQRWNPIAGVSLRLTPTTVVRAGAFQHLNANFFGSIIAPPTVAGFVLARNEFPTARRHEYNVSVEHSRRRGFVGVRAFARETTVPYLLDGGSFIPEADATGAGASVYANWIASRRLTVFADNQTVHIGADVVDRVDNLLRVGLNYIHPRGLFVRLVASHVSQGFSDTTITDLPESSFALADLEVSYEFAGKRGLASLRVTNAFDRRFETSIEGISIDTFVPDRRILASLRWRLW